MSKGSYVESLVAAGLGANKGFWMIQPRDRGGQWIEMGAELLALVRGMKGKNGVSGSYVGPGSDVGKVSMLIRNSKDLPDGVYEFDSHTVEKIKAILDPEYVKSQGIPLEKTDKFGNKVSITEADLPTLEDVKKTRRDATPDDVRLADGDLTPEEKAAEKAGRDASPIAELPGGFESLNREEAKQLFDKADAPKVDAHEDAVKDALADVAYDGDTKATVDDLIKKAGGGPETVKRGVAGLMPGNVYINNDGKEITVLDTKNLPGTGGKVRIIGQDSEGNVINDDSHFGEDNVDVLKGVKRKAVKPAAKPVAKPVEKPAEKPTPEAPEAPEAPATPKKDVPVAKPKRGTGSKPKVDRKPKEVTPDRKDDGKDIAATEMSLEDLRSKKINNLVNEDGTLAKVLSESGAERTIEDPNAIIDALLEVNPNAKVKDNGAIVMERGSFTDTDGKSYKYEVSVERTVGNQFMERYTLTDAETGEVTHDFYNADYKDSFAGLYGKTSGLTRTRDLMLGRDVPGKKGVNAEGVPLDKELANYFGPGKNIDQRLKYLRKGKDVNGWRLVSPKENIDKFMVGRARLLNKADGKNKNYRSQFGNVRRSFVASIYEAIDLKDTELLKERLVQLLGRTPDTPESVNMIINALKDGIDKRYAGTPRHRELAFLPIQMQSFLDNTQADLRNRSNIPFVSEDGVTPVVPGDRVRFINNEGDMVIGTVVKLNAGSGKNGGYKDTARVKFADGKTVDNLQTRNMLHTDDEPTDYATWVRNDEKIRRRAEELGIDFDEYMRRKEDNPDFTPDDPENPIEDAGAPYIGEAGTLGEDATPTTVGAKAEDLLSGDALYSSDGDYIGTVIDTQSVPAEDGGEPGIAVKYIDIDGKEQVEILDSGEFRGPK